MTEPTKIQRAIALNGIKTTSIPILDPALGDGKACYDKGFGLLNFTPKTSGGIPPWGADMNGFLYDLSNAAKYMNSGGVYVYDSAFQTAISGYPIGALLRRADGLGYWQSTVDGNMTNPDTGGAGWVSINTQFYGVATGTGDAITATIVPAITSWYDGLTFFLKITNTNTVSAPTVSPNGLAAKTIKKGGGVAVRPGDLATGMIAEFKYNGTDVFLQNPATSAGQLIGTQIFSTVGTATYTETPGTIKRVIRMCGGGAAGGSCAAATGGTVSAGGGGGAGAFAEVIITGSIASQTVTIGAGGTPGAAGNNAGGNGGASSFGALITCPGGSGALNGGSAITATSVSNSSSGGVGGAAPTITGTTILACKGDTGKGGFAIPSTTVSVQTGSGGTTPLGTPGYAFNSSVAGIAASGYGAGGSGAASVNDNIAKQGGAGAQGICIVWEYA